MKYLLLFLVFLVSCSKNPSTPEGLIEMYVEDLTTKGASKDYFEKYTAGKLWDSVADLSEEDFSKFVNMKKIKNAKINILNKNCASKNVHS